MTHPLFGLFAEPASMVLVSTVHENISDIEKLANQFSYFCSRMGTTGGDRLEISVYGDVLISASISELRSPAGRSLWKQHSTTRSRHNDEPPDVPGGPRRR